MGTLLVGVVALALIVSQTPWFRDWLRRYIVRESKQYLNGELSIGSIGGNLLFGVQVSDIAVDLSGERVVAAKGLEVGYDVFQMISKGVILSEIKLIEPKITLERDGRGWNVSHLVKKQEKEANREGPRRPIDLQAIEIADGRITIADHTGADGYRLPGVIEDLDLKASYAYAPVHYSVVIDRASMRSSSPQMALTELTGKLAVRDDNLYIESMSISTTESWLKVDGVVENYLSTPVLKITTTGKASLPEFGRVLPAAGEYALHPQFNVKASGPADKLLLDLDVQSEAGIVRGQVTADVKPPDFAARGDVNVERFDLAPILKSPAQRSDITGQARVDLRFASAPASRPFGDRIAGSFTFRGPTVLAAGYQARNVKATGTFADGRINLDASAAAYGGTGTAKGFVGRRRRDVRSRSICAAVRIESTFEICRHGSAFLSWRPIFRSPSTTSLEPREPSLARRCFIDRRLKAPRWPRGRRAISGPAGTVWSTRRAGAHPISTCRGSAGFSRSRRSTSPLTTAGSTATSTFTGPFLRRAAAPTGRAHGRSPSMHAGLFGTPRSWAAGCRS